MWKASICTLIVAFAFQTSTFAQSRTRDGATVGGVAGAVIGGIIGHQNDETPEGALIGGAVGALAGGLLGRQQDQDLQRQRYYQQQAYYQQQQQAYVQQQQIRASGVSLADVASMSRSGVGESLIINQLQTKGVQRRLEVADIISLHQQGVSDTIITAMQSAPLSTQVAAASQSRYQPAPQRVVVREQPVFYSRPPVVVERTYVQPYPVTRHHYYHYPARSGATFRIGF